MYKYTGELVTSTIIPWNNKEYQPNHLYEAIFVPSLLHVYPDRPQSPVPEGRTTTDTPVASTTTTTSSLSPAPAKSTAYVPPSARKAMSAGGGTGTSLAERLRREKEGTVQGATKVVGNTAATTSTNKSSIGTNRVIPGLTQTNTTKTKSQLKREKLKQKLEQQQTTAVSTTTAMTPEVAEAAAKKEAVKEPMATGVTAAVDINNSVDVEKRVRKLKKILKQIEDLKLLSVELNDDQKAKVASEPNILSELKDLGA